MIEFFDLVGVIVLAIVLFIGVGYIVIVAWLVKDFVEEKIDKYKFYHRFDKTPIAKCYCKDCILWDKSNVYCTKFNHAIEDCGFCWFAEPKGKKTCND